MNTEEIKNRNIVFIREFINKHKLKYMFEDLMAMHTVYINFDEWSFRVFGIENTKDMCEILDDGGNVIGVKPKPKQKKFNIYNYQKKKMNKALDQEEIFVARADFITFVLYWNELKVIKEFEQLEEKAITAYQTAQDQSIKTL